MINNFWDFLARFDTRAQEVPQQCVEQGMPRALPFIMSVFFCVLQRGCPLRVDDILISAIKMSLNLPTLPYTSHFDAELLIIY